jgi:hypothetical protein
MISLDKIHIATAITDNVFKDVVKVMASSFVRNNPDLQLHVYCLNFTNESYAAYCENFNLSGVVLHQVEYHNPYNNSAAVGIDRYHAILNCTGVKFKLAEANTQDYLMWVDADTFFAKPLSGIERFISHDAIYGVPRTKFVPVSEIAFNAGVLLFPKSMSESILDRYTTYCYRVQEVDIDSLGWSDEHFIRDEFPAKGILPLIYNATPSNYSKNAVIGHLVGKIVPWETPTHVIENLRIPHKAIKPLCESWLAEYQRAKSLLSYDFIKRVEA